MSNHRAAVVSLFLMIVFIGLAGGALALMFGGNVGAAMLVGLVAFVVLWVIFLLLSP